MKMRAYPGPVGVLVRGWSPGKFSTQMFVGRPGVGVRPCLVDDPSGRPAVTAMCRVLDRGLLVQTFLVVPALRH